jgi:valyl-tRNA synthetase
LLTVLHPFMPFISEELWHFLCERNDGESIMIASWPPEQPFDESLLRNFDFTSEVITAIRSVRKEKNIPQKEVITLMIKKNNDEQPDVTFDGVAVKLCNLDELKYVSDKPENAFGFRTGATEFFIPVSGSVDMDEEIKKLNQELDYQKGFLHSVMKKLANENFVRNANEQVVNNERRKQSDAEAKIRVIEEQLRSLANKNE